MQVYSTLMKIANKQKYQAFIYLGIFIALIMMMTNAQADSTEDYADVKCQVAIFDYDNTDESEKLVDYLSSIHEIKELEDDESVILDTLYLQNVDYVLYINKGYSKDGKLTNIKRPGSAEGGYVDNQINAYESSIRALKTAGYTYNEAHDKTIAAMDTEGLVTMYHKDAEKRPAGYFVFLFTPYVAAMLLFNILVPVLVAYNRKEVSDRAKISPMSNGKRNLQLVLASLTISLLTWVIFSILGFAYCGADLFKGVMPVTLLNILIYVIVVVSFSTIMGNFNLKPQAVSMISNIYGLGTSFLGGVFVTTEIFSDGMLKLAHFMPTFWYVQVLEKAYDGTTAGMAGAIGMQLLFALIFIMISVILFKRKR